jgi:hypothetical protein
MAIEVPERGSPDTITTGRPYLKRRVIELRIVGIECLPAADRNMDLIHHVSSDLKYSEGCPHSAVTPSRVYYNAAAESASETAFEANRLKPGVP